MSDLLRVGFVEPAESDPPSGFQFKKLSNHVKLASHKLYEYRGQVLSDLTFLEFCRKVKCVLKCPKDILVLEQSLLKFRGSLVDENLLSRICLYLYANKHFLDADEIIPRWVGEPDIWVYSIFYGVSSVLKATKPLSEVTFRCFSNVLAGDIITLRTSTKWFTGRMKEIGFPAYERAHPREAVLTRAMLLIGIDSTRLSVKLKRIEGSSSQITKNRELHKARREQHCSEYIWPCYKCFKGFEGVSNCPLACKRYTKIREE